jgi:hypothetical protein
MSGNTVDHEKQLNDLIPTKTPSSEHAKDHGSSLTENATDLKSPTPSSSTRDKSKRASYAQPTQASKARHGRKDPHQPAPTSASAPISPRIPPLTSPLLSPTSSTAPRFQRYKGSVDINRDILSSLLPPNDTVRPITSLAGSLKSPSQHTQKLRTKASQHRLNHRSNKSDNLKPSPGSEEREEGTGHGTAIPPAESHGDHEVQSDSAFVVENRPHDEYQSPDLEATEKVTISEKLEALPKLVLSMEEGSVLGTEQATTASPTKEHAAEELTGSHQLPDLVAGRDEHDKLRDEMLEYINQLEQEIEALNHSLHEKDKELKVRNECLLAQNYTIEYRDEILCDQNEVIKELNKSLRDRSEKIEYRDGIMRDQSEKTEELNKSLRAKTREHLTAMDNAQISQSTLVKLREDFTALTNAAKKVLRRDVTDRLFNPNMLEGVPESTNFSQEAQGLYSAFLRIMHRQRSELQKSTTQFDKHREDSAEKKRRLEIVEKDLETAQEREKLAISERLKLKELESIELKSREELEIWKQRYEDGRKLKEKAQRNYQSLKRTAEEMYRPDLEKTNKKLQSDLVAAQHENIRLQERIEKYKVYAQDWKDEYNTTKAKAGKEHVGLETEIKRRQNEITLCIREYNDKCKANSHWDIKKLQERNSTLERNQEATTKLLNATRQEKIQLEEKVIPSIKEENKKLNDEWARRQHALSARITAESAELALDQPLPLDAQHEGEMMEQEDTTVTTSALTFGMPHPASPHQYMYIPRCLHPAETTIREAKLEELRQRQQKRREDRTKMNDYLEGIMHKARKRKMGDELYELYKLYEQKGWSNFVDQSKFVDRSSREIWDRDGWMYHVDKKEAKLVTALRHGVLYRGRQKKRVRSLRLR